MSWKVLCENIFWIFHIVFVQQHFNWSSCLCGQTHENSSYADDLVIIANSLEELKARFLAWKAGMEQKGLRVSIPKTVFMISGTGLDTLKDSGKYPCSVCRKGVMANSILCTGCDHWVHKKCSGIRGRLTDDPNYICPRCRGSARPIDGRPVTEVTVEGCQMKVVSEFIYLGDMLSLGGGCTRP